MRSWITGVAIVTGRHQDKIHGMTANSFNSIALDPPTVMVALQHRTRTQHLVKEGGFYGVTILDVSQIELAKRFAGQTKQGTPRFEGVETFELVSGVPFVSGGMAFLDCKVVRHFDVGNTTVFIGEIIDHQINPQAGHEPLLYFNRQWRKLDPYHD
ncbi:flavin reductase family protein [bacterium]|nr:flavin reductase family protein [bacterium]